MSLSVVAQTVKPKYSDSDPKVVFEQLFEDDFKSWSETPVDTIDGIYYFKTDKLNPSSSTKIWSDAAWQTGFIRRDTVIDLLNGVMQTDNQKDIDGNAFYDDSYNIISDGGTDIARNSALGEYGVNGGSHFFRYSAGDGSKVVNASGGSVPEYRRNLFVRLKPGDIEDNSSYRVTMYLKTTKMANGAGVKNSTAANFTAELMRGYFSSEKDFVMGYEHSADRVAFNFSKNDFIDGQWEKLTYMAYYLNGTVQENYCYYNGYHDSWGEYWRWKYDGIKEDTGFDSLCIIRQPDKIFLRISFRSDSTIFDLDNISITKSYIGGIQHTDDMLRVDFGYQTNLKQLAKDAKKRTNIPAVELPGKYFTVLGRDSLTHEWKNVEINSAEYHDDGYMYMWTKPRKIGNQTRPVYFNSYDSVLVSFVNPSAEEDTLALYYNGSTWPNNLDADWVAAGKRVFDFTNELSTPNPNIKNGVYSMKNRPPVLQKAPYENGSFGLDGKTSELRLGLSKLIVFDPNEDGSSDKAFCQVFKNGVLTEIWPVSEAGDNYAVFKRKNTATDLDGDYTFKFVQLKATGTAYGDPIVLNYHFGALNLNPEYTQPNSDWRGELVNPNETGGCIPASTYIHDGQTAFMKGDNKKTSSKSRLYVLDYPDLDNCAYYIANRTNDKDYAVTGNMYSIVHLKADDYTISFKACIWNTSTCPQAKLRFFPKPDQAIENGDAGFALMEGAEKTELGLINPTKMVAYNSVQNVSTGKWPQNEDEELTVETFSYPFTIATEGDYVFEWVVGSGNTNGILVGNYFIKSTHSSSADTYVSMINSALEKADAKKAEIDASTRKYKGADYEQFVAYLNRIRVDAFKEHAPSVYNANATAITAAATAMQYRMDTVDLYYTAMDTVIGALTANAAYSDIDAYKKLNDLKTQYGNYDCSRYTSAEVSATADLLNAAIAKLSDRIEKTDNYAALLEETKIVLDSTYVLFEDPKLEGKDLAEYDTLKQTYEAADAKKAVLNTLTDDEFFGLYDGLESLKDAYVFGMEGIVAKTRQIRELFALAETLGYDFGGAATKDSLKNLIINLRKRDAVLENVIKEAVVLQIYKKFAAGESFDSLDVSALIPNYYLYTDGVAGENMEQKSGIWVVKTIDGGNSTVLPGWTFASIGGSNGYWMPTTTTVGAGDGHDWTKSHAFISGLRCGPQTSGTINSDSFNVPAGFYQFGLRGYNQTSNVALELISDSCSLGTGSGSSLKDVYNGGSKFNYKNVSVDSIKVSGNTVINIKQTSASGSEFDMRYFFLILRGSLDVDYAALATAQETKLADLITFVAPVSNAADAVAVQYYNLNGVQIAAPEAGKIVIKRTILSNGASIVEKILVK